MHECPDCYMPCTCGGDIDDMMTGSFPDCQCPCNDWEDFEEIDEQVNPFWDGAEGGGNG